MTLTTPPFRKFFSGVTSRLLGSHMPNFKFAYLAILELLAFNAQKIKGHVTLTTDPFRKFFPGVMSEFGSRRLCQISSKSVKNCDPERARTHTQKCVGHRTSDTANDFIFCPMLLYIALDRQKYLSKVTRYFYFVA